MARKINVIVESDLSGSANADTVEFGWGGKSYEIDLTDKEKADFEKSLKKYLEVARTGSRKAESAAKGARKVKPASTGPSPASIRVWAAENGIEVPARGRIPESVIAQYNEANPLGL
jgi:hypothetical protein